MVFMGAISYPFYMYHQAINGMFHGLFLGQIPRIENAAGIVVGIAVLLTAGSLATLSTFYYEQPFRKLGKKVKYLPSRHDSIPAIKGSGLRQTSPETSRSFTGLIALDEH